MAAQSVNISGISSNLIPWISFSDNANIPIYMWWNIAQRYLMNWMATKSLSVGTISLGIEIPTVVIFRPFQYKDAVFPVKESQC